MKTLAPLAFAPATRVPDTFNVLLYGPPKSGKSTAAATAPGPIMWLNLEGGGALSYARKIAAERGHDIHEVRVEHTDILEPVLRSLVAHVRSGTQPQVQTVVVDTLGKVRDHLARNIGGDHPQIQHWGDVAKIIEGFVKALRDLPVNVVFLAHEEIKEGENGEGRIVEPLIGGKSTVKVCGEVDVIAYTARVPGEGDQPARYMGQLVEGKGRRAGDRSGGLGVARQLDLTEWLFSFREALAPAQVVDGAAAEVA
jgi:hypothetical protein